MNKTVIKAEVVADSLSIKGDRLTSLKITFPRIILAEVNTHRMLSKNTSSSRAIPFKKMVESVENDPFIPIAWQKEHKGMQGTEYITDKRHYNLAIGTWLMARDEAVKRASELNSGLAKLLPNGESKVLTNIGVTKQLVNRLLEPFMWTTMLITGSKEGWNNFFKLRCPQYTMGTSDGFYKSRKDLLKAYPANKSVLDVDLYWLSLNKGQAEIHMMDLAEKVYDAMNESTPKQLKSGEWHIPFEDNIDLISWLDIVNDDGHLDGDLDEQDRLFIIDKVKISTAMAARESYTVVGNEKNIDYQKQLELHDRLISQNPPHSSPLEHCNRAMTDEEYESFIKGNVDIGFDIPKDTQGWCNNIKGFIPYRYMIDNNLKM